MSIPQVKDYNGLPTLFVKDEPFFCLAGELHNSDTSDPAYMEREVWPRLQGLNMNSVIAPIYWECIEKTEGVYDFSSLDVLIRQAREAPRLRRTPPASVPSCAGSARRMRRKTLLS